MARGKGFGNKKALIDKVRDLDAAFADTVYSLSVDELNKKLADMAKYQEELNKAKEDDSDLKSKREALKVANQTYSEPTKAIKLKTKLVIEVLQGKGKA